MAHPVRTCVGCRGRAARRELLRIVWRADGPLADPAQTAPGRGAYLHRSRDCLDLAVRRRSVGRALRIASVDPESLTAVVTPHLLAAAESADQPVHPHLGAGSGPTSRNRSVVA